MVTVYFLHLWICHFFFLFISCQNKTAAISAATRRLKHTLPDLKYDFNALEPYISADIMRLHYEKHHNAYVNNLNVAEEKLAEAVKKGVFLKCLPFFVPVLLIFSVLHLQNFHFFSLMASNEMWRYFFSWCLSVQYVVNKEKGLVVPDHF